MSCQQPVLTVTVCKCCKLLSYLFQYIIPISRNKEYWFWVHCLDYYGSFPKCICCKLQKIGTLLAYHSLNIFSSFQKCTYCLVREFLNRVATLWSSLLSLFLKYIVARAYQSLNIFSSFQKCNYCLARRYLNRVANLNSMVLYFLCS